MANPAPLGFGDGPEPDAKPKDPPPQEQAPKKPSTKKLAASKAAAAAKPVVICQRCKVPCEPMPKTRGWVRCSKCGWKHKTFDGLQAAKQALRAQQSRNAR